MQFVLIGSAEQAQALVEHLGGTGVSLSVAAGGGSHAFHIHTDEPDRVLEAARAAGTIARESVVPLRASLVTGLVALADGPGFVAALGTLGAVVVAARPGHEPWFPVLVDAIERAPGSGGVVVLADPNGSLPSATLAADRAKRPTGVVAAASVPAALAAATAYDPALDLDANAGRMRKAARACVAGEVIEGPAAVRSPSAGRRQREWIAMRGDRVVLVAADPATAALGLTADLVRAAPAADVLTIVLGDGAVPAEDPVVAALRRSYPDLHLHPVSGGRAGSRYLIGVG